MKDRDQMEGKDLVETGGQPMHGRLIRIPSSTVVLMPVLDYHILRILPQGNMSPGDSTSPGANIDNTSLQFPVVFTNMPAEVSDLRRVLCSEGKGTYLDHWEWLPKDNKAMLIYHILTPVHCAFAVSFSLPIHISLLHHIAVLGIFAMSPHHAHDLQNYGYLAHSMQFIVPKDEMLASLSLMEVPQCLY